MNDINTADDVAKDAEAAFARHEGWSMNFVFPFKTACPNGDFEYMGLTKRELFAAMAMQGLLSDPEMNAPHEPVAQAAVGYADALLKELAK